jgi:hypothetical protein
VDAINQNPELTDAQRIDHLRLIRSDNVGPRGIMAQTPQAATPSTDHMKGVVDARINDWSLYRVVDGGLQFRGYHDLNLALWQGVVS